MAPHWFPDLIQWSLNQTIGILWKSFQNVYCWLETNKLYSDLICVFLSVRYRNASLVWHWTLPWLMSTQLTCSEKMVQTLLWRHNGRDGVSNHQPHDCLLNPLLRRRSKKTSKLRVTGLCAGNSPVAGEFPAQMASNAENGSIWWRHHVSTGHVSLRCFAIEADIRPCNSPIQIDINTAWEHCGVYIFVSCMKNIKRYWCRVILLASNPPILLINHHLPANWIRCYDTCHKTCSRCGCVLVIIYSEGFMYPNC